MDDLESLLTTVRPRFGRAEPRRHAETYVRGLLSDLARKNGWTLAAFAGAGDATSMQRMLNAARWDTDGVRDEVRQWVAHGFGDWRRGMLVVDEVRFPKAGYEFRGRASRDTPRVAARGQRTGRGVPDRTCPPRGRALWWTGSCTCRRSGSRTAPGPGRWAIPDEVGFADRDELAMRMVGRAFDALGPAAWVVGGGSIAPNARLRTWLEQRAQPYVLPSAAEHPDLDADRLAERVPRSAWVRVEPDLDEQWALVSPGGRREAGVLLRRRVIPAAGTALYRCQFPPRVDLADLVWAARAEGAVRADVRTAVENVGLDQYQVRRYDAWYRHMTLCLLAAASLVG